MTARKIVAHPLTHEAFAPFGAVIDKEGGDVYPINGGKARRFHARAKTDVLDGEEVQHALYDGRVLGPGADQVLLLGPWAVNSSFSLISLTMPRMVQNRSCYLAEGEKR